MGKRSLGNVKGAPTDASEEKALSHETSGGPSRAMQSYSSHQKWDRPIRCPQQTPTTHVVCLPNMLNVDLTTRKQPDKPTWRVMLQKRWQPGLLKASERTVMVLVTEGRGTPTQRARPRVVGLG